MNAYARPSTIGFSRRWIAVLLLAGAIYAFVALVPEDIWLWLAVTFSYLGVWLFFSSGPRVVKPNPLSLFLVWSIPAYGYGAAYYYSNIDELFFLKNSGYSPVFSVVPADVSVSFYVFILGLVSYSLGTRLFPIHRLRIPPVVVPFRFRLAGVALIGIVALYLFRTTFNVAIPGKEADVFPFIGLIYFPLKVGTTLLLAVVTLSAIRSSSRTNVVIALVLLSLHSLSIVVLGWKSPLILNLVMLFVILSFSTADELSTSIKPIKIFAVAFILMAVLSFPIITIYRNEVLFSIDRFNLADALAAVAASFDSLQAFGSEEKSGIELVFMQAFERLAGIGFLVPIVSFGASGDITDGPSFIQNLLQTDPVFPENYLTNQILGVGFSDISTNAPTPIGAFYIYGGVSAVMFGMFFLGYLFYNLYRILSRGFQSDDFSLPLYTTILVELFFNVVIEGTIINYAWKYVPGILLAAFGVYGLLRIFRVGRVAP